jgi:uncharacterized membrane protein YraQ (UPF0718 family)
VFWRIVLRGTASAVKAVGLAFYAGFVIFSWIYGFDPGKRISINFLSFGLVMLKFLPCAFVLIGLFEVWVKKQSVEKYLGSRSGPLGYILAIILASTSVGGLYVAFPVAYSLYSKGAKLSIIFTYLGASAVCRIPMIIFEVSFMGIRYSAIRILVSLPLVIICAVFFDHYLSRRNFKINQGNM